MHVIKNFKKSKSENIFFTQDNKFLLPYSFIFKSKTEVAKGIVAFIQVIAGSRQIVTAGNGISEIEKSCLDDPITV